MISYIAILFCFFLLCGSSEYGTTTDGFEHLDVHNGVTADQILPVPGTCFAETVIRLNPGDVPERDFLCFRNYRRFMGRSK